MGTTASMARAFGRNRSMEMACRWMGGIADAAIGRIARVGDAWIMSPGIALERLVQQQRLLKEQREALGCPLFGIGRCVGRHS